MQSFVQPVWRGLLVSVRCENPLAKGSLRAVLGQQFRDGIEQSQTTDVSPFSPIPTAGKF